MDDAMLTQNTRFVLAPYGSMEFASLVTKVGEGKNFSILAPYGSMKLAALATKVSGKATAPVSQVSV